MKRARSGTASGKGAVYLGRRKNVGKGRTEIADDTPPSKVTLKLDLEKPFETHNVVPFTLERKGGQRS